MKLVPKLINLFPVGLVVIPEKLIDIVEYIRKNKTVTKQDMVNYLGWGRGIKWSPYRRAILKHPNIFDTMSEYPNYVWKE